jgi:hypothetical protein
MRQAEERRKRIAEEQRKATERAALEQKRAAEKAAERAAKEKEVRCSLNVRNTVTDSYDRSVRIEKREIERRSAFSSLIQIVDNSLTTILEKRLFERNEKPRPVKRRSGKRRRKKQPRRRLLNFLPSSSVKRLPKVNFVA